jgi:hypothetical protein
MRWVEIICARLAGSAERPDLERLADDIRARAESGTEKGVRLVIYRNRLVENDWSVHLYRESEEAPAGRTELGITLADIVRPVALVDHSIWIEEDRDA